MNTRYKHVISASVVLALATLGGCKKIGQEVAQAAGKAESKASARTQGETRPYNAYVKAYNGLSSMFYGSSQGLEALLQDYRKQDLGAAKPHVNSNGPLLYLNTSMLNNAVRELEAAQAGKLGGEYEELQTKGAQFLETTRVLLKQGSALEDYFKSKKYLEDGFAKARAENAGFIAQWEKFNAEYSALGVVLDGLELKRRQADIQRYEKEGMPLEASREKALLASSQIIKMLNKGEGLKNAQTMQNADATAKELETALARYKEELDKLPGTEKTRYQNTYTQLNNLLGHWRDLKRKQDPRTINNLVEAYNWAVRY